MKTPSNSTCCQIIADYFKVFHSVDSFTLNNSSIFQPKAHLYLLRILSHLSYMFRHVIYTIFRENLILLAPNQLLYMMSFYFCYIGYYCLF